MNPFFSKLADIYLSVPANEKISDIEALRRLCMRYCDEANQKSFMFGKKYEFYPLVESLSFVRNEADFVALLEKGLAGKEKLNPRGKFADLLRVIATCCPAVLEKLPPVLVANLALKPYGAVLEVKDFEKMSGFLRKRHISELAVETLGVIFPTLAENSLPDKLKGEFLQRLLTDINYFPLVVISALAKILPVLPENLMELKKAVVKKLLSKNWMSSSSGRDNYRNGIDVIKDVFRRPGIAEAVIRLESGVIQLLLSRLEASKEVLIAQLLASLSDADWTVKRAAAQALAVVHQELPGVLQTKAVNLLLLALKSEQSTLRDAAAQALAAIFPNLPKDSVALKATIMTELRTWLQQGDKVSAAGIWPQEEKVNAAGRSAPGRVLSEILSEFPQALNELKIEAVKQHIEVLKDFSELLARGKTSDNKNRIYAIRTLLLSLLKTIDRPMLAETLKQ